MPADEMQQTRTLLEAIVSGHWTARLKFGAWEEIADLQAGGGRHIAGRDSSEGQPRRRDRSIQWSSPSLSRAERFLPAVHRHGR
jgi:hypothetical protein